MPKSATKNAGLDDFLDKKDDKLNPANSEESIDRGREPRHNSANRESDMPAGRGQRGSDRESPRVDPVEVEEYRATLTGEENLPNLPYREGWHPRWMNAAAINADGTRSFLTPRMRALKLQGWEVCTYEDYPEMDFYRESEDISIIGNDTYVAMRIKQEIWDKKQQGNREDAEAQLHAMQQKDFNADKGIVNSVEFGS